MIEAASAKLLAGRRKLRSSIWPDCRNVVVAVAGLCGVALAPQTAFSNPVLTVPQGAGVKQFSQDEEVYVALNSGRFRLADDITSALHNNSLCVDFQQLITALDFPILLDRSTGIASGWFISEEQSFSLNFRTGAAEVRGKSSTVDLSAMGALSTGSCITLSALGPLMGLTTEFDSQGSVISISAPQQLPIIDRLLRQSRTGVGSLSLVQEGITPRLKSLPYRAFVPPNSDVSITFNRQTAPEAPKSYGATWSVLSVGELAYMTAEMQLGGTEEGFNGNISRFKLYRTERDGGVFGINKLTDFSIGDISAYGSTLGSAGGLGLGIAASSFPLNRPTSFDRTTFEGPLPQGWDVELYRNGQLLETRNDGTTGGYSFRDVPVLFGDNNFEIIQYGPQGQRRAIAKRINATNFLAPKGQAFYRAAIYRPEVLFARVSRTAGIRLDLRAAYGISDNFNIGGGLDSYVYGTDRLTVGTLSALTSVSGIALNAEISGTSEGKFAGQVEFQGNGVGASWRGRLTMAQDKFVSERLNNGLLGRLEASADRALTFSPRVGGTLSGRVQFDRYHSGESTFSARQRMTLSYGNKWLAQSLTWSHSSTGERRDSIDGEFSYSSYVGRQSMRGVVEYSIHPKPSLNRLGVSVERAFSVSDTSWRWRAETNWTRKENKFIHSMAIGRMFNKVNFDLIAETDGKKSHSIGLSLGFSFGRRSTGWGVTSRQLAQSGAVRARIFQDMDDNGMFNEGDVPVQGASVVANNSRTTGTTDKFGYALVDSVAPNDNAQINVITDDLDDPNLYGRPTLTRPREGTVSEISIPLTQMGSIEGTVTLVAGSDPDPTPLGGVNLVLLDAQQKEVSRTMSAYDGYYSFDLVPVGSYIVAVAPDTSLAKRVRPREQVQITTSRTSPGTQGVSVTLIETNPTRTRMALRGLL